MIDPAVLLTQIENIEQQLAVMKAQLKQAAASEPPLTAADLYGICKGLSETTEEDFEAAKYRVKWPDADCETPSA